MMKSIFKKIALAILVMTYANVVFAAFQPELLEQKDSYFNFFEQPEELAPADDVIDLNKAQTEIAKKNEKEYSRFSVLNHQIFNNDKIRVFNFTAFDDHDLKNKLNIGHFSFSELNSIQITFGYGIEYLYDKGKAVGYEYLSAFPYDRGQLIRIYWNQSY